MIFYISNFVSNSLDFVGESFARSVLKRVVSFCKSFLKMILRVEFVTSLSLTGCFMVDPTIFWVFPKVSLSNFLRQFPFIVLNFVMLFFEMIFRRDPSIGIVIDLHLVRLC